MKKMNLCIKDLYPKKAQFLKNERIELRVEIENCSEIPVTFRLEVRIYYVDQFIEDYIQEILNVPAGLSILDVAIQSKDEDFKGFGADAALYPIDSNTQLHVFSTSFDVVSNWRKSPRYGFLSDFAPAELGTTDDVNYLNKLHINLVQFYDWMYRHDELVPPRSEFTDLMGRELSLSVVKEKVALCHALGMKAIAYGAVYAASQPFFEQHPDWALYDSNGKVLDLIGLFFIMNISDESPWPKHIISQYKKALEEVGFDGIHMDTYGAPKTAFSRLHGVSRIEKLKDQFPFLINSTRSELEKDKEDVCLIFNNVGNWPVDTVALAAQDAMYIEVWHPYERYHHIQQIIRMAKFHSEGKPVILAAYLKPFREQPSAIDRANFSALLLTAVISANGGYHLLHGENQAVLTQGYYVDYTTLEDANFVREIRNYYDFIVRYANLLFDDSLEDVSMTHTGWDNIEYVFGNFSWSAYGEASKVWTLIRENAQYKTISFINLTNNEDDLWNEGKNRPSEQHDLQVNILLDRKVKSVFMASPDIDMGRHRNLNFTVTTEGSKGQILKVVIPDLYFWDLLVVELEL
ncbi:dextranase [Paenibacillus sp. yr247]|uniref:glycoside hydrolase family 66 protein n=1 Tax=Paenibacillus sp. yr247 TaxID=1761880 RepID=UPI00088121B8|nr:glycoside hydrolase family 66 protein [Paenibacillus sp. yr247]SDN52282.1 dextranase [Paenibacillus sp. yr247]